CRRRADGRACRGHGGRVAPARARAPHDRSRPHHERRPARARVEARLPARGARAAGRRERRRGRGRVRRHGTRGRSRDRGEARRERCDGDPRVRPDVGHRRRARAARRTRLLRPAPHLRRRLRRQRAGDGRPAAPDGDRTPARGDLARGEPADHRAAPRPAPAAADLRRADRAPRPRVDRATGCPHASEGADVSARATARAADGREGTGDRIREVTCYACSIPLPRPLLVGAMTVTRRTYDVVRIRTDDGLEGVSYAFGRGLPVARIVEDALAPLLVGADPSTPELIRLKLAQAYWPYAERGLF